MIPKHIWIETSDENEDAACDVIVEMEDGQLYTAMFVTLPYLHHQMELCRHMAKQLELPQVSYTPLETPHIVVENLNRDTLEDTIDNMLALDVFEGCFTLVTEDQNGSQNGRTTRDGTRATAEVAAVVIAEVLTVNGD
jgi:hypothetical protein